MNSTTLLLLIIFLEIFSLMESTFETEYEGCFGTDVLVSKVPEYLPSHVCWKSCDGKDTSQIAVVGVRWCGCPSNGLLGAASNTCEIQCSFIPNPKCVCYHGDPGVYDRVAQTMAKKLIKNLPKTNKFQGYSCTDTTHKHIKVVLPSEAVTRAHKCIKTCNKMERKYGAYLMGYKCGCKKTEDAFDDTFLPVSKDCVERMVCMELPASVCLCGNEQASSSLYPDGVGPLLVSDKFQCQLMDQNSREARVKRIQEYGIIRKNRVQATECLQTCNKEQYRFAGLSHGGSCSCQNHVGHRKFTNEDCWSTCTAGGTGCGGPYTTSVYSSKQYIDIDYCRGNTDDCSKQTTVCKKTEKTYLCECIDGYRRLNRTHCTDVNECVEKTADCDTLTTVCNNTIGGFHCLCNSGYNKLDLKTCLDVDECKLGVLICGENARCLNTVGSYRCDCLAGFTLTATGCEDVDECFYKTHDCDVTSSCKNTVGGFTCQCLPGYQRLDSKTCTDLDECIAGGVDCGDRLQCVNTVGTYRCECASGYKMSASGCQDVDECLYNSHGCDSHSTVCKNTEGGYQCDCKVGYTPLDQTHCQDIDECQSNQEMCVSCKNTVGSFICQCYPGYKQSGRECIDVNECAEVADVCASNSVCDNTVGSYQCHCLSGYIWAVISKTKCIDINECLDPKLHSCRADESTCFNTPGSYSCPCQWGYTGDGRSHCSDINECEKGISRCSEHAACSNTMGSFTCTCRAGYSGNGKICKEVINRFDLEVLLHKVTPKAVQVQDSRPKLDKTQEDTLNQDLDKLLNEMTVPPGRFNDIDYESLNGMYMGEDGSRIEGLIANNGMGVDVSKDNSPSNTKPWTSEADNRRTSLDIILDQIGEHEKAITHVTNSPNFVKNEPKTKTKQTLDKELSEKMEDPVIKEAVSLLLNTPHNHRVSRPPESVQPEETVLEDIMGDPDLSVKPPAPATESNMDLIMDQLIIHEQQMKSGEKHPSERHRTRPVEGVQAGQQPIVIAPKNPVDNPVTSLPNPSIHSLDYIEPANDLVDITDELLAKGDHHAWGYEGFDDDRVIDMGTTKASVLPGALDTGVNVLKGTATGVHVNSSPGVNKDTAPDILHKDAVSDVNNDMAPDIHVDPSDITLPPKFSQLNDLRS